MLSLSNHGEGELSPAVLRPAQDERQGQVSVLPPLRAWFVGRIAPGAGFVGADAGVGVAVAAQELGDILGLVADGDAVDPRPLRCQQFELPRLGREPEQREHRVVGAFGDFVLAELRRVLAPPRIAVLGIVDDLAAYLPVADHLVDNVRARETFGDAPDPVALEGAAPKNDAIKMNADPVCVKEAKGPQTQETYIVGGDGKDVATGEVGELWYRGPVVVRGYWRNPQATAETFVDGWIKTGDLGKVDEEGFLYIVDRAKDMVLVGGFNVFPNEVDEVLNACPGIAEAASAGIKARHSEEELHAFVVRRDPALTSDMVMAHCAAQLTGYKRPRTVHFVDELPKSPIGKILRRELRTLVAPA